MTTPTEPEGPAKGAGADEIEADIERTREQLGETVEALAAKFDVKAQAQHKVHDATQRARAAATDEHGKLKPVIPAGAAIAAITVTVALVLIWRRR